MALQRTTLGDIQAIGSSYSALLTNAAGVKTYVKGFMLHNVNTTSELVTVHVVPDAAGAVGTAADGNEIMELAIVANDTVFVEFPGALTLTGTNDTIQGKTTTNGKVTIIFFGDKE